jgi:hypothetical protein
MTRACAKTVTMEKKVHNEYRIFQHPKINKLVGLGGRLDIKVGRTKRGMRGQGEWPN